MKGAANRAKAVQSTACPAASRAPGVLRAPAPQGGQPEQDIEPRPQPRPLPAQEEDQHQQDAVAGVIKIEEADAQECCGKEPPPPRLEAPHGQQTEEQSEEDVPVHPLRLPVPGVGGQDVTGLGDESKEAQPAQISLDIPGVEQPHRHAVAEDGEGQPPHPAKGGVLWKKHGPYVVQQHGQDGDQLQKIGVQVGAQPRGRLTPRCPLVHFSSSPRSGAQCRSVFCRSRIAQADKRQVKER